MVPIGDLLLPILVSGVVVFLLSFVMWMVLPFHKADWKKLADEDAVANAVRGNPPGQYMFPHCSDPEQMKSPEFQKRYKEGPTGHLVIARTWNMGVNLGRSIVYNWVIALFVAYVAGRALAPGAAGMDVLQLAWVVTFLAYAGALGYDWIWRSIPGDAVLRHVLDAFIYGLGTGLVFMWLWPGA